MSDLRVKKEKLALLVDTFRNNIASYKTANYKEARVRDDFIDKFFLLLDWDLYNEAGETEDFRDVLIEDNLEISGAQKAPDYAFRIGGNRVFFVEAKKPLINVKEAVDPAFQVRRYGYTAKLPVSILTDFEEFAVYDTRLKPHKNDKASYARLFYCRFEEFEQHFDFLYETFSKEAVRKGSIKKYIDGVGVKKGTSEVDKEFLKLIEEWRTALAKNLAVKNLKLDIDQLNLAVQKIIDRIIFLRIAEDKDIEQYETLLTIAKDKKVYATLVEYFGKANKKYNSELFRKDEQIDALKIDDEVLADIITSLYYPDCPYALAVLPIETLGNIYEQFLGKTIRLTDGHHAKIEEKPEVRKAGGVYYTPEYIVKYIVENTVGEKVKDKTPKEIEALTILDPACGSGSFLIGAYTYLLNYHLQWYTKKENLAKALKEGRLFQKDQKSYHLTIQEKQKILLNNIYGVDIDRQAVEVTKLSLMLKLLEGENHESAGQLFKQTDLKLLPTLSANIKCGNSLIGSDFYADKNISLFEKEDMQKVNVFDWEKEFPAIFKKGGFDTILGNPPYVKIQSLQEFCPEQVGALKKSYFSASTGNTDLYLIFLEKALALLSPNGVSGYILPHKFFQGDLGKNTRNLIAKEKVLMKIISFGANQIFEQATTYTCLFFMIKKAQRKFQYYQFELGEDIQNKLSMISPEYISADMLIQDKWGFHQGLKGSLLEKLEGMPIKLKNITRKLYTGIQTSANDVYVLHENSFNQAHNALLTLFSKQLEKEIRIERGLLKPFLLGKDIKRYAPLKNKTFLLFPYLIEDEHAVLMDQKYIKNHYPYGWEYLFLNKKVLEAREKGKMIGEKFYSYVYPKNLVEFEKEKITCPDISDKPNFAYDAEGRYFCTNTTYGVALNENAAYGFKYYLAILNSSLFGFYVRAKGTVLRGGFSRYLPMYMESFPILEKSLFYDSFIDLVDQLLIIHKKLHDVNSENEKTHLREKINILECQINTQVYRLYELTEEEIKIVEDSIR